MSVLVVFHCDGCEAHADSTSSLKRRFQSFGGRDHGVGQVVPVNTVEQITPEGWVAFDPHTFACYCPKCWEEIDPKEDE